MHYEATRAGLDPQLVLTGYWITPVVAFVQPGFELKLDAREVAGTFEVPLAHVLDTRNHRSRERMLGDVAIRIERQRGELGRRCGVDTKLRLAELTIAGNRAEVREIPGTFGDPFRAIEAMPAGCITVVDAMGVTDAEQLMWFHLRNRSMLGAKFRRQCPVGPFVADFVCAEARLIVEIAGGAAKFVPVAAGK